MDAEHRLLHQVGGGALHRHVDRHPLGGAALHPVGRVDLGDVAAAAHQRGDIAGLLGVLLAAVQVALHLRVLLEVGLDEAIGLGDRHAGVAREAEGAEAVDDPEVGALGDPPLVGGHLLLRDVVDQRGRAAVDILAPLEGGDQVLVAAEVGQDAEFHLRVVRADQDRLLVREEAVRRAVVGDERAAHLAPEFGADRDVLQVGVDRAEPPGRRDRLVVGGVDTPRLRVDHRRQRVDVGRLQLAELAEFEDRIDDRVLVAQLFEDIDIGRITLLGALLARQPQLLEEHLRQLLRRVDVERVPGQLVDLALALVQHLGDPAR